MEQTRTGVTNSSVLRGTSQIKPVKGMQLYSLKALQIALLGAALFPLFNSQTNAQGWGWWDWWNRRNYCHINILQDGALRPNVDATALSSKEAGGIPGSALVRTKGGRYSLQLDTPVGFNTAPVGGNDNVVFATTFSGYGRTNFSERPGESRVRLKNGDTNVEVHFLARKLNGSFQAGNYSSTVTLRCE